MQFKVAPDFGVFAPLFYLSLVTYFDTPHMDTLQMHIFLTQFFYSKRTSGPLSLIISKIKIQVILDSLLIKIEFDDIYSMNTDLIQNNK